MKCTKCGLVKDEEEFAWKKRGVKRASACKACHRLMAQSHYQQNKQYYKNKSNVSRPALVARGKQFVIDYLLTHPCVDCGNTDIDVLEFDHVLPLANHKAPRVCTLLELSIVRIEAEIAKCEVRCANCHVKRTRQINGTLRK